MVKKCGLQEKNHKVDFFAAKIFLVKKLTCKWRQHTGDPEELCKLVLQ